MSKIALIIGAGPAGLTAAYELVTRTDIKPIVLEQSDALGGISQTVNHNGNRIDIGGHRFFSKSDVIMEWWLNILPLQGSESPTGSREQIYYQNKSREINLEADGPEPESSENIMLLRKRTSRIYFLRKFFDYPISLSKSTLTNLGLVRVVKIAWSYLKVKLFPIKEVKNLEDFFINRFGKELYYTFFKNYTEKVWGVPCTEIDAEWGEQRIKELSVTKTILHALRKIVKPDKSIHQKDTETSLIEQFLYPKYGPGQMWERVAEIITEKGGTILKNSKVTGLNVEDNRVHNLDYENALNGEKSTIQGDYVFSTMPVKHLINAMNTEVPAAVKSVSDGLQYRDFITVGLLLNKLKIHDPRTGNLVPDNWIYIQEPDVKLGRLQIFNNWSPYMVKDENKIWLGLEYFCNQGDDLWNMNDDKFIQFAINELDSIDIIDKKDVLDYTIVRMPKAYPAYFGSYSEFHKIRKYVDQFNNLFLIGRNGMHKYNNQDHSMLTAITAVDNIINKETSKSNIWEINTEDEYHEQS